MGCLSSDSPHPRGDNPMDQEKLEKKEKRKEKREELKAETKAKLAEQKEKRIRKRTSLATKVIVAIELSLLIFGLSLGAVGLVAFTEAFKNEYASSTLSMARTASSFLEGDKLETYLKGEAEEEYGRVKRALTAYCFRMNISFLYVIAPSPEDPNPFAVVFSVVNNEADNSKYTEWARGQIVDLGSESFAAQYDSIYDGASYETVLAYVAQDSEHGHIASLVPIYDHADDICGILCIQRPMKELTNAVIPYVIITLITIIVLGAIAAFITANYIRKHFVEPVEKISAEASRFAAESRVAKPLGKVSGINELSELAASMDKLETEMIEYIDTVEATAAEEERLKSELSLAASIQLDAIPSDYPAFPDRKDFDIFGSMTPARGIGGDYYNYILVDDDHLALWIGDVSGKGIPAALFMMKSNLLISEQARNGGSPASILAAVNNELCENNQSGMFVTVWLGILELSSGKLVAANAGHEFPVVRHEGTFELLKDKHGFVLAGDKDLRYVDYEILLSPGDMVFVYSDGLPEATNISKEMFKMPRVVQAMNDSKGASPEEVVHFVKAQVDSFVGEADQFDDLTMLCLQYKGRADSKE